MAYSDEKFGELFPTRHGVAIGAAAERKMLDSIGGAESFRTIIRNNLDGSTTRCRTRNGMPHFETTGRKKAEKKECVWSFSYSPIKTVNGTFVPDTIQFGIHTVPQMSIDAGSKIRRKGVVLKKVGYETVVELVCDESGYEGSDRINRIHGSHGWYKGDDVVTWTKRTYVPIENPQTNLPKWVPVGVVRYRDTDIEVFPIGGSPEDDVQYVVVAACLVSSPNGARFIRAAKAFKPMPLDPAYTMIVSDYTITGTHVSELVVDEGVYFHNIVEGFCPAMWSQDGLSLIVGVPYDNGTIAKIYTVTRPNLGVPTRDIVDFKTVIEKPSIETSETVNTNTSQPVTTDEGNLQNLGPFDFYVRYYGATASAQNNQVIGDWDVSLNHLYTPKVTNNEVTTTTITNSKFGSFILWPDSVGFSLDGQPCVVVGVYKEQTSRSSTKNVRQRYGITYSKQYSWDDLQIYSNYAILNKWTVCDKRETITEGADVNINTSYTTNIEQSLYITVGNGVVWQTSKTDTLNGSYVSNTVTESYSISDYDRSLGSAATQTSRYGLRTYTGSTTVTPNTHITLNSVAADFISGHVSVFEHEPVKEEARVRNESFSRDEFTERVVVWVTGEVLSDVNDVDGPYVTDVSTPDWKPPEKIEASVGIVNTVTGGTLSAHVFQWPSTGLGSRSGFFDGTAAWCYINETLMFLPRTPSASNTGWMYNADISWVQVVPSISEPVVTYGANASVMFRFDKLSPFA